MKVIRILMAILLAATLTACATYSLPKDATPEQKQAAACVDAKAWARTIDAGLKNAPLGSKERLWYESMSPAAQAQIEAYCF